MSPASKNGLTAGNSQPVKKLTKRAKDFIATCAVTAMADSGLCLVFLALLMQAAFGAWRVLQ